MVAVSDQLSILQVVIHLIPHTHTCGHTHTPCDIQELPHDVTYDLEQTVEIFRMESSGYFRKISKSQK